MPTCSVHIHHAPNVGESGSPYGQLANIFFLWSAKLEHLILHLAVRCDACERVQIQGRDCHGLPWFTVYRFTIFLHKSTELHVMTRSLDIIKRI